MRLLARVAFGGTLLAAQVYALSQGVSVEGRQPSAAQSGPASTPTQQASAAGKAPADPAMFSDDPKFAVAGVTDWTAVGGHGSDATLRTSEDLARATQSLGARDREKSPGIPSRDIEARLQAAYVAAHTYEATRELGEYYLHDQQFDKAVPLLEFAATMHPAQAGDEYLLALACRGVGDAAQARAHVQRSLSLKETADADRLAGELDEQLGDPLRAVQQEQRAAQLEPSEENYFAWGSELLLHRATWQAAQVFGTGAARYPSSARMLTGWGSALFADALYSEASEKLCRASDLNPDDAQTYLFMGKVELAAPRSSPCIERKFAQRVQAHPDDPAANYFYAICLTKQQGAVDSGEIERLLRKAVLRKPTYAEAYLQLGILCSNKRQMDQAVGYYRKAVDADPNLAEAHYRLASAYDRSGSRAMAKQEFAIHAQLEKEQADAVEQQRRAVKQFSIATQGQPSDTRSH